MAPSGAAYSAACYGGLTLLAKLDGRLTTWAYNSALWTSINTYNDGGSVALDLTEVKTNAFNVMPITRLRVGMAPFDGSAPRWLDLPLGSTFSSLQALIASGSPVATSAGRAAWKGLVGPAASLQLYCNAEGINPSENGAVARIGLLANNENDCSSPDSVVGLGVGLPEHFGSYAATVGNIAPWQGNDNGFAVIQMFGYILATD